MPIVHRVDSDGSYHDVWAQEQANSCAVAAIWMATRLVKQLCINEGEWDTAMRLWGHVIAGQNLALPNAGPMSIDTSQFQNQPTNSSFEAKFGNQGTFMREVRTMIGADNIRTQYYDRTGSNGPVALGLDPQRVSNTRPVIMLLGWYSPTPGGGPPTRNGGHFVVAVGKARNRKMIFLDPWQGRLVEQANNGIYPGGGIFEEVLYLRRS